jgi:transcriptional regulator of aromatic amino acid metabolism
VGWGTVVLRRIESMSQQEQRVLHGWFKPERGGVQVVSLASPRLFELVSTGAFQKALFYRLNVIMLMT